MDMYMLKFSACLFCFWLLYIVFFERSALHGFKRFYLLGSILFAAIIPLITITTYVDIIPAQTAPQSLLNTEPMVFEPSEIIIEEPLNYWNFLLYIYGIGVIVFSIRFILNLTRLLQRVRYHHTVKSKPFILVLLLESLPPHSFFNYLFLNKDDHKSNAIPKEVMIHEEAHARQLHSLDIILMELLQIVLWFNPLIYILKHHIKLNHEFLADQAVLNKGIETKNYQTILLDYLSHQQSFQLTSSINYSSIKKRITVMKTNTSKKKAVLQVLLVIPLTSLLLFNFTERNYVERETVSESSDFAEKTTNLFLVTVEKNNNTIELKCEDGCRWSHLVLEPRPEPYIINDFGFSNGNTLDRDLFTFAIKPSETGVALNGLKGTAWIDLEFSLTNDKSQAINQLGMAKYKSRNVVKTPAESIPLSIEAINDELRINSTLVPVEVYASKLNEITKNWSATNFRATIPDLKIESCSQGFLDELDRQFRKSDYFKIVIEGSKQVESDQNPKKIETGFLDVNGQTLYFTDFSGNFTYYNSKGYKTNAHGEPITPLVQAKSTEILPNTVVTKVYRNNQVVAEFSTPENGEENSIYYQEGASKRQLSDYNEWAKTLNKMIKDGFENGNGYSFTIHSKEVETYKDLYYNVMTEEQRKNAVPFPNLPPPPPPPPAPTTIEVRDVPPPPPPPTPVTVVEETKTITEIKEVPPPPPPPNPLKHIKELAQQNAVFYYEGELVSSKKAIELVSEEEALNIRVKEKDTQKPVVHLSKLPIIKEVKKN